MAKVAQTPEETTYTPNAQELADIRRFPKQMGDLYERRLTGSENLTESEGLLRERVRLQELLKIART